MLLKAKSGAQSAHNLGPVPFALRTHGGHFGLWKVWRVVRGWIERSRQRRALMWLDDHALADMGLTRVDVAREVAKPFWR